MSGEKKNIVAVAVPSALRLFFFSHSLFFRFFFVSSYSDFRVSNTRTQQLLRMQKNVQRCAGAYSVNYDVEKIIFFYFFYAFLCITMLFIIRYTMY